MTTRTVPATTARLLAALGVLLLLLLPAGVASAHTQLLDSNPADGATLDAAPKQIVLTFEEAPLEQGLAMVAVGPDGSNTPLAPRVDGAKVIAAWPTTTTSGAYQINWRVVADDGHPVSGNLIFTIAAPASANPKATPTTESTAAASAAPTAPGSSAAFPTWALLLAAVLLAVVIAAVVVVVRQRHKNADE